MHLWHPSLKIPWRRASGHFPGRVQRVAEAAAPAYVGKKARQANDEVATVASATKGPPTRPIPDASEETWQKRNEKFHAGIDIFKNSEPYLALVDLRLRGEVDMSSAPRTPNPDDESNQKKSKRAREVDMKAWRDAVKDFVAIHCD